MCEPYGPGPPSGTAHAAAPHSPRQLVSSSACNNAASRFGGKTTGLDPLGACYVRVALGERQHADNSAYDGRRGSALSESDDVLVEERGVSCWLFDPRSRSNGS